MLGWFRKAKDIVGQRNFIGFYFYDAASQQGLLSQLTPTCQTALTRLIDYADEVFEFQEPK
jgi:hypothetical protein